MLRNCTTCGGLFVSWGGMRCDTCLQQIEGDMEKVREYLRRDPGASINVVAAKTGVPHSQVLEFIRQGRIVLQVDRREVAAAVCVLCKASIADGRICAKCESVLAPEQRRTVAATRDDPGKRQRAEPGARMFAPERRRRQGDGN